jgi:hypothetical protein
VVDHVKLDGVESEDHLVLSALTDDGRALASDQIRRLFDVPAQTVSTTHVDVPAELEDLARRRIAALLDDISARQGSWFDEEMDKLDRWAEDKRTGLKADLREHDETLKALKRDARQAASLPEKLTIQKKIKHVEATREEAWRAYDAEARTVEAAKEALIDDVETRLTIAQSIDRALTIRFRVT